MKTERVDSEFGELLEKATPEPREGWRERALARMRGSREPGWGSRLRWAPTALGAALVIAALALAPYSAGAPGGGGQAAFAAQEALAAAAGGETAEAAAGGRSEREEVAEPLKWYAGRAAAFVQEHYPDDPEMLIAAGMLTRDLNQARELLKSAVEKRGGGAAWSAYAQTVMEAGPGYDRLGAWVVDPADSEAVARVERLIAESGVPQRLTPEEAEPVLDILRKWQEAEPENALPLAYEVYYMYGMHLDREALVRWEEAAALPEVSSHAQEFIWYAARLLEEMGMSPWQAVSHSYGSVSNWRGLSKLRSCARIGVYEGWLAEMEGRDQEAIRLWMATSRFGQHMQESADTLIEFLQAIAIEGTGASPVWKWQQDGLTSIPDGPLVGGRLFHGRSHEFFVREAGQQAADEMGDSLAKAKMRSGSAGERLRALGISEWLRATTAQAYARISLGLLLAALLVFAAVSMWARPKADEATSLRRRGRVALALIALAPLAVGSALAWQAAETFSTRMAVCALAGVGASLLLLFLLPLVAAFRSRVPEARVVTAWRGNLRRVLPLAVVALAIVSLGLVVAGHRMEAQWIRSWRSETEIERVERLVGPEWENPTIPPDAWRNEPPPEPKAR